MNTTATDADTEPTGGYRALVMSMLFVVYTFNFLDRQILSILAIPIQEELGVSDTQVGLMRGLAFALFYTTLGVPVAWLADRANRVWIMTVALTLWSGMTAACGLVQNAWQLFFARMGVGVGEAGGVAPAYSLISDYFPGNQRARALAFYSFGIPVGSAVGLVFGAVIQELVDWRAAFLVVGLAGVMIAPLFRLLVREPKRGRYDPPTAKTEPAPIGEVVSTLIRKPSFWTLSLGASFSSMMGYGLFAWLPAFFVRSYSEELGRFFTWLPAAMHVDGGSPILYAGYFYGAIVLVGGLIGVWLGGVMADRFGAQHRGAYARVPAIAFLASAPLFAVGVLSPNLPTSFFVFLIPTALSLAWLGPILAALQHIVPPNMRATASAFFLLINNFIGLGLGDVALGGMSDLLSTAFGEESLRYSILAGTSFYLIASALLFWASRLLPRDWEE